MTKGELDLMLGMLTSLAEHYRKVPDSLIMKVFGVFTVKTSQTQEVHLMLIENTL